MKVKELLQKSVSDLQVLVDEKRKELFKLRMKHYSGQLLDSSLLKKARKDISSVLMLITQKENEEMVKEFVELSQKVGRFQERAKYYSTKTVTKLGKGDKIEIGKMLLSLKMSQINSEVKN